MHSGSAATNVSPVSDVPPQESTVAQERSAGEFMEATHRYRLLIYFVALVLCLSVCFAYAEEPQPAPNAGTSRVEPARLLFQTEQGHVAFMPPLMQSFIQVQGASEVSVVSATKMDRVSADLHHTHGFLHGLALNRHKPGLIVSHSHDTISTLTAGEVQSSSSVSYGQSE